MSAGHFASPAQAPTLSTPAPADGTAHVLVLARDPISWHPVWDWLGGDTQVTVIASTRALDGSRPPSRLIPLAHYDGTGEVEALAHALYRSNPFGHVIALAEPDQLRAAKMRDALRIPGQGYASALAFRDKIVQKDHLAEAGISTAACTPIDDATDLIAFADRVGHSLVVKPRRGTSSTDVHILETAADLKLFCARTFTVPAHGPSPWMAEAYVSGQLLQVDGIWRDGGWEFAWTSALTDLAAWRQGSAVVCAMLDPGDRVVAAAVRAAAAAVRALPDPGLAAINVELWLTPTGELLVNEIAACIGARTASMIRHGFGLDMVRRVVRGTIDLDTLTERIETHPRRQAGWVVVPPRPGYVRAIPSHVPGPVIPGLVEASIDVRAGQHTAGAQASMDIAAAAVAVGRTATGVVQTLTDYALWVQEGITYSPEHSPLIGLPLNAVADALAA